MYEKRKGVSHFVSMNEDAVYVSLISFHYYNNEKHYEILLPSVCVQGGDVKGDVHLPDSWDGRVWQEHRNVTLLAHTFPFKLVHKSDDLLECLPQFLSLLWNSERLMTPPEINQNLLRVNLKGCVLQPSLEC